MGAAFLCADLELATEPREENASYIASWLEILKNDTRFIFKAAAHAQRAADYLRAFAGSSNNDDTTTMTTTTTTTTATAAAQTASPDGEACAG